METSIYLYIVKMAGSRTKALRFFFKTGHFILFGFTWLGNGPLLGESPFVSNIHPIMLVGFVSISVILSRGIKHGLLENSLFSSMMFPVPRCVGDFPARHVQCPEGITIIFNMKTLLWLSTFGPIKSEETSTMSPLCLLTNVYIYYCLKWKLQMGNSYSFLGNMFEMGVSPVTQSFFPKSSKSLGHVSSESHGDLRIHHFAGFGPPDVQHIPLPRLVACSHWATREVTGTI